MEPVMKNVPAFSVVGLCGWFEPESAPREIPKLWERFVPRIGDMPPAVGGRSWGVCFGHDPRRPGGRNDFFYLAGVEVADHSTIPDDMVGKSIAEARYAVFTHQGGLAGLKETMEFIWGEWLSASQEQPSGAPDLELYDERFDPVTGELDILVPLAPRL